MLLAQFDIEPGRAASGLLSAVEVNGMIDWNLVGPALFLGMIFAFVVFMSRTEIAAWWATTWFGRRRERRRMMKNRNKEINELAADYITDALEEAYFENEITLEEKQLLYRKIGRVAFKDLLARGELSLKEEIKKRRAEAQRDAEGKIIPVKLPGQEEPTQILNVLHVHVI